MNASEAMEGGDASDGAGSQGLRLMKFEEVYGLHPSAQVARRPAAILGSGDHDVPDAGHGLQVAAAPDPRADTQHIKADAAGNFSS